MNTYEKFKVAFLGCTFVTGLMFAIVWYCKQDPLNDNDIRASAVKYCSVSKALENARVMYKDCVASIPDAVKITDADATYIKECRRNSYDTNGINDYTTGAVEINPRFIEEHRDHLIIAKTPLKNGTYLTLPCESNADVKL